MFGKHFLLQAEICLQKLVPATPGVPCSRIQDTLSFLFMPCGDSGTRAAPSTSCLVEALCMLQVRASAQFLDLYSVWLMLSSRQPERKVFRRLLQK